MGIYSGRADAYSLAHKPWINYFQIGDIVQIDYQKDGIWDHTMIVTKIDSNDMYMTYRGASDPPYGEKDVSLNYLKDIKYPNAGFMGYRLKN